MHHKPTMIIFLTISFSSMVILLENPKSLSISTTSGGFLVRTISYHYKNLILIDEVWISSVKRAQLPPIPSLEGTASSCVVTGVVPAITPPTLKLGIRKCNVLKQNGVNDSFLLNIPLPRFLLFCVIF